MIDDPPRLSSLESESELADLVRDAQAHLPGDDVVARIAANLGVPPPPGAPGGGASAPATPSLAPGAAPAAAGSLKLLAVAAFVAGAGIAVWVTRAPTAEPSPVGAAVSAPAVLASVAPERPASAASVVAPQPSFVAPLASVAPHPPGKPFGSVPAPRVPEKPSEVELLSLARKAARTDPARALALTAAHQQAYPRGALSQEREVLAIEALAALGNAGAAQARARAFQAQSPSSPYAERVTRAIKKSEAPGHE